MYNEVNIFNSPDYEIAKEMLLFYVEFSELDKLSDSDVDKQSFRIFSDAFLVKCVDILKTKKKKKFTVVEINTIINKCKNYAILIVLIKLGYRILKNLGKLFIKASEFSFVIICSTFMIASWFYDFE